MKAVIAIILSIYVLVGSAGMPLSMHTCLEMEQTEYGFDLQDSCCSSEQTKKVAVNTVSETGCCKFLSTYLQVDYEAFSHAGFFNFEVPIAVQEFSFEYVEQQTTDLLKTLEGRAPPLFSGRTLLAFVQSFLL